MAPDNILGIISGLLNASGIPMTGRSMAVGKSPLTGGWGGDSNAGGRFGPKLLELGWTPYSSLAPLRSPSTY